MGFDLANFADVARNITAGSDKPVLPNVAYGGPAEQSSTPAGNGFGTFLRGSVDKALNYAIEKDREKTQQRYYMTRQGRPEQQEAPRAVQPAVPGPFGMSTTTMVLLGAAAVGVVAIVLLRK